MASDTTYNHLWIPKRTARDWGKTEYRIIRNWTPREPRDQSQENQSDHSTNQSDSSTNQSNHKEASVTVQDTDAGSHGDMLDFIDEQGLPHRERHEVADSPLPPPPLSSTSSLRALQRERPWPSDGGERREEAGGSKGEEESEGEREQEERARQGAHLLSRRKRARVSVGGGRGREKRSRHSLVAAEEEGVGEREGEEVAGGGSAGDSDGGEEGDEVGVGELASERVGQAEGSGVEEEGGDFGEEVGGDSGDVGGGGVGEGRVGGSVAEGTEEDEGEQQAEEEEEERKEEVEGGEEREEEEENEAGEPVVGAKRRKSPKGKRGKKRPATTTSFTLWQSRYVQRTGRDLNELDVCFGLYDTAIRDVIDKETNPAVQRAVVKHWRLTKKQIMSAVRDISIISALEKRYKQELTRHHKLQQQALSMLQSLRKCNGCYLQAAARAKGAREAHKLSVEKREIVDLSSDILAYSAKLDSSQ